MSAKGRDQTTGDQGFVLVNALVLVAALAAVATLLLSRAEQGRSRLESGLVADQLNLSLDAFDALAISQLAREPDLLAGLVRARRPSRARRGRTSGGGAAAFTANIWICDGACCSSSTAQRAAHRARSCHSPAFSAHIACPPPRG